MKTISLLAPLALLLSLTLAAPAASNLARQDPGSVSVTLHGATNDPADQYTVSNIPLTGVPQPTNNKLSISHIDLWAGFSSLTSGVQCCFYSTGLPTAVLANVANGQVDLGPPQYVDTVACVNQNTPFVCV